MNETSYFEKLIDKYLYNSNYTKRYWFESGYIVDIKYHLTIHRKTKFLWIFQSYDSILDTCCYDNSNTVSIDTDKGTIWIDSEKIKNIILRKNETN